MEQLFARSREEALGSADRGHGITSTKPEAKDRARPGAHALTSRHSFYQAGIREHGVRTKRARMGRD